MINSQNCYDALGRTFSCAKLDECGAFDAEAVLSLGDDVSLGQGTEEAWFQSETAAGRYLKPAQSVGRVPSLHRHGAQSRHLIGG